MDGACFTVTDFGEPSPQDFLAALKHETHNPKSMLTLRQHVLSFPLLDTKGVVYRDLKPANTMLTFDHKGELLVKIVDFGTVKLTGQPKAAGDLDRACYSFDRRFIDDHNRSGDPEFSNCEVRRY